MNLSKKLKQNKHLKIIHCSLIKSLRELSMIKQLMKMRIYLIKRH
jgi:hypothetical protein